MGMKTPAHAERSYRPKYLLELINKHPEWSDEKVWDLIIDTWIDTEMPYQQRDLWRELFSLRTPTDSFVLFFKNDRQEEEVVILPMTSENSERAKLMEVA